MRFGDIVLDEISMVSAFQVVLPFNNKNQAGLERTLSSLQKSVERDFEIILVNDSSTTVNLPSGFDDLKVSIIDLGANYGISTALKHAEIYFESDFIARIDCGDEIHPERFAKQLKFLRIRPEFCLVGVRTDLFLEQNNKRTFLRTTTSPSKIKNLSQYLLCSNPFAHGAIMFRKNTFVSAGGYDEQVKIAQDLDLYLRLSRCAPLFIIDEILQQHTFSDSGTTLSKNHRGVISGIKIRFKYLRLKDLSYIGFWYGLVRDVTFLMMPKLFLMRLRARKS